MGSVIGVTDVALWAVTLAVSAVTLYYAAIISGLYKDPLLARFRLYGEERRPYPVISFLVSFGVWCVLLSMIVRVVTQNSVLLGGTRAPLIFTMLALMSFAAAVVVARSDVLRASLPRWYFELLQAASREERRLIAYAWLRIPRKMRWRLNGDHAAFRVWADMVRLTVIYGARDPDDPWAQWT